MHGLFRGSCSRIGRRPARTATGGAREASGNVRPAYGRPSWPAICTRPHHEVLRSPADEDRDPLRARRDHRGRCARVRSRWAAQSSVAATRSGSRVRAGVVDGIADVRQLHERCHATGLASSHRLRAVGLVDGRVAESDVTKNARSGSMGARNSRTRPLMPMHGSRIVDDARASRTRNGEGCGPRGRGHEPVAIDGIARAVPHGVARTSLAALEGPGLVRSRRERDARRAAPRRFEPERAGRRPTRCDPTPNVGGGVRRASSCTTRRRTTRPPSSRTT